MGKRKQENPHHKVNNADVTIDLLRPLVTVNQPCQPVGRKKRKKSESYEFLNPETEEAFNYYLSSCYGLLRVHRSAADPRDDGQQPIVAMSIGKFRISVPKKNRNNELTYKATGGLSPDLDCYWYASTDKDCSMFFFEKQLDKESKKSGRLAKAYFLLVDSDIPVPLFNAMKSQFVIVRCTDTDFVDAGFATMEVLLKPSVLSTLQYPSEMAQRKNTSVAIQSLMEFFYGFQEPTYDESISFKKPDIEELYRAVLEIHSKDPLTISEELQHEHLLPQLREYQKNAVAWMLNQEKREHNTQGMDSSRPSEGPSPIPHQHHSADEEEEEEEEEGYDDEEEQPRAPTTKRTMEEEEEEEIHSGVEADSEEVQQPTPQQPAKKKKGRGGGGGNKAGWSLPDVIEEDLVEWLRSNSYLWLRSTKDYKRKKEAWQMKAEELKISLEHLQKWWKNLKDWYVKLLKKTNGQARKPLTGRDKWVLNSLSFYHSQMQVDLPDTLNTMARSGSTSSSSSAPAALTSRPPDDDDDDEGMHILSDIESQEAQRARDTTTTTKKKTRQQKPEWTVQLIQHLQENHALLERVLLPQPQSLREAFIRYATDVFRTVSDEEYQELQFSFEEALRRIVARRAGAVPPPQATTSTTPSLHQMTPLTSLSRYLWSPSTYYGMDHLPQPQLQPESPSQMSLTTPPAIRMSADFTSQQLQEDFP